MPLSLRMLCCRMLLHNCCEWTHGHCGVHSIRPFYVHTEKQACGSNSRAPLHNKAETRVYCLQEPSGRNRLRPLGLRTAARTQSSRRHPRSQPRVAHPPPAAARQQLHDQRVEHPASSGDSHDAVPTEAGGQAAPTQDTRPGSSTSSASVELKGDDQRRPQPGRSLLQSPSVLNGQLDDATPSQPRGSSAASCVALHPPAPSRGRRQGCRSAAQPAAALVPSQGR